MANHTKDSLSVSSLMENAGLLSALGEASKNGVWLPSPAHWLLLILLKQYCIVLPITGLL